MVSIAPPSHTRREGQTTDDWITPKELIDRLLPFDLDPCASVTQPWPCADRQYTVNDNGLLLPWQGMVYMNPPYGRRLGAWLERLAEHNDGIALIFARTDTRAFFKNVWDKATSLVFIRGRLTFCRPDGTRPKNGHNSGGPSVLIAYGKSADLKLWKARDLGRYVSL